MELFHLIPSEFAKLHRWDILSMKYYLILKNHYEDERFEEAEQDRRKADLEKETMDKAPRTTPRPLPRQTYRQTLRRYR